MHPCFFNNNSDPIAKNCLCTYAAIRPVYQL